MCLTQYTRPVADAVPVIFGEFGESYNNSCGSTITSQIVDWADQNAVGYEAWAWNTWDQCSDLIASFDGIVAPSSTRIGSTITTSGCLEEPDTRCNRRSCPRTTRS